MFVCSRRERKVKNREYIEDPDPPDEDDPEFKEEMFRTHQAQELTPDDFRDQQEKKEYAEWLKK
jgi:hypothetical protein